MLNFTAVPVAAGLILLQCMCSQMNCRRMKLLKLLQNLRGNLGLSAICCIPHVYISNVYIKRASVLTVYLVKVLFSLSSYCIFSALMQDSYGIVVFPSDVI